MNNKKRTVFKVCGKCGRPTRFDISRNYCPVTAQSILRNRPADSCKFFIPMEQEEKHEEKRDVR